ncbi:uncharacterized protein LOC123867482 isoform X2 [Maniola jurtina]|uniref:uncharacterized protein LOC123867482 isoform X2 n=1 Tax=Maniola jurtina TaxID=191418 RepID=UPI001E68B47F|nr:uncharacterized protein LOC123867482 isoform X2 [Maniola jurtina]
MAGNKINTKKKDDKSKSSRNTDSAMEESEDIDFSLLRKPILTSITGFAQARKIFDLATEELKGLLSDECDLLYECKVCRNMFRSLANFLSHKRVYCKEKFNSSVHGHFLKETSVMNEVLKIKKLEESYQESLREQIDTNDAEEEDDSRIPIMKDLTSIIEKITKNKGLHQNELENNQLVFQKIPKSSVAVFQNVEGGDTNSDTMKAQVDELNDILSQENAVLQSDGSFKVQSSDTVSSDKATDSATLNTDNVIQISDDDDNEESDILKCKICDLQFSTQKTLKFHIKYKHLENRLVYPCPDCLETFSTSWSVYRHLFKVHRKTAAQIRRLRESIQAKAFRMNNPPAFYEKRKTAPKATPAPHLTEEERLYKENQAWLEELDGEGEGRRCGGCGRTFERRAALAAHAHTCARRHRRRIQIQIRKDYHKEPSNPYLSAHMPSDSKSNTEDVQTVEKVQEDKDVQEDNGKDDDEPPEAELLALDDKQPTTKMDTDDSVTQNKPKIYDISMINNLPFAQQIEKNNLNAFRQKIQSDVDLFKLLCKKCDVKHDKFSEFLKHMSGHYKWVRYACKLCNFKHFNFDKLPEHVKVVHKLKGNTEFFYSTVKAIDGTEALELSESVDEPTDANETSPESRRPSRCSSDSSRLSDDSSSSSTRPETGSRKRKSNIYRSNAKKKREALVTDNNDQKEDDMLLGENDTNLNSKMFEENSSDLDDVEEKSSKRQNIGIISSVASRRPIRKRTTPKNADFEYDLSNLLKMEAQGYRDSQTTNTNNTKVIQTKKKAQQELLNNYDTINKDCCGAMITLSRKSLESAQGHMKTASFPVFKTSKESRISSIFARPMIPRITRADKISPKKVETEEIKNTCNLSKIAEPSSSSTRNLTDLILSTSPESEPVPEKCETSTQTCANVIKNPKDNYNVKAMDTILNDLSEEVKDKSVSISDNEKKLTLENDETNTKSITETEKVSEKLLSLSILESNPGNTKPPIKVPIKFGRQSLEVIKNPIIKRNITDFSKAGMKTKILVIKPINRNADGIQNLNAPLKFQTIKLKDACKSSAKNHSKKSDQIVVVKVPQVDRGITRPVSTSIVNERVSPATTDSPSIAENEKSGKDVFSNKEQTPYCDDNIVNNNEKILDSDETSIDISEKTPKNDEKTLNSNETTLQSISNNITEKDTEQNLDHKDQMNSESDHIANETINENNQDLMEANKIASQDS